MRLADDKIAANAIRDCVKSCSVSALNGAVHVNVEEILAVPSLPSCDLLLGRDVIFGVLRMVCDYRMCNDKVIKHQSARLPTCDQLWYSLDKAKIISCADALDGCWLAPLDPSTLRRTPGRAESDFAHRVPSLPACSPSGCQRKTCKLDKTTIQYMLIQYMQLFFPIRSYLRIAAMTQGKRPFALCHCIVIYKHK